MSFKELKLIDPLLKAIHEEGYETPTPIQSQAIPVALTGKDLLGCAQTGTGKSAAFILPILQHLVEHPVTGKNVKALILTPTRELAIQIDQSIEVYGKFLPLKHQVVYGGVNINTQISALRKGTDLLVATPGRLLDLINQRIISLQTISHFVLDEADRMLDMGFIHDIKKVVALLPQKRQTLFFSATMPEEIAKLANTILRNPVKVEVTPVSSTAETVAQVVYAVDKANKPKLLVYLLNKVVKDHVLVFSRTKHGADRLVRFLDKNRIKAEAIHGNKSQNARQNALNGFKSGRLKVLIATDIAARGIDVEDLKYVINFDLPNEPETYVHRIGRTGRAGTSGKAISFCDIEERPYLQDINNLINQAIPVLNDHPYPVRDEFVAVPLPKGALQGKAKKETGPPNNKKRRFRSNNQQKRR
ncbi:DEAD/DEAH box helicase [Olivibacter domesticus]|uniref:DEAD-box ATP-dependent RNA helicase RhpA n=1 Tax=Olivibacter domesticus TaxID=407022 RepID=A0A1H7TKN6_OLID1|nr:DEAD/DEAH box helicase [Olivibacter domesticus]SEL85115.1 ATP-dependent RNA helicase RhlE [Olivibacter domesticus]